MECILEMSQGKCIRGSYGCGMFPLKCRSSTRIDGNDTAFNACTLTRFSSKSDDVRTNASEGWRKHTIRRQSSVGIMVRQGDTEFGREEIAMLDVDEHSSEAGAVYVNVVLIVSLELIRNEDV
jgi:hypothetical protein